MSRSNNRLQLQFALFLCGFYEIKLEKHRLDKKKTIIITDFLRETAISILHLKWNAFFSIGVAFAITVRSKIDEKTRKMGKINRITAKKAHKNESRGEKSSKTRMIVQATLHASLNTTIIYSVCISTRQCCKYEFGSLNSSVCLFFIFVSFSAAAAISYFIHKVLQWRVKTLVGCDQAKDKQREKAMTFT